MKNASLILALLAIAGCKHEVVVPGGTVTTDASGQVTKIQTKDATTEVKGNTVTTKTADGKSAEFNASVSEADLGVPFYPGSQEGAGSSKITEGQKTMVSSVRTTSDSGKQVVEFYTSKLGAAKSSTESGPMSMGNWEKDGKKIIVMCNNADGKTTITVSSLKE